jgi:uncharacterized membrane protein
MTEQTESLDCEEGARAWTFRGNQLDPARFATAMIHLYRGEVSRSNTWRTRLDATTNWAVVTVAAALTFVFGAPHNPHFVLLLVLLLVFTFLYIEARRYRYYALWSYRVRLMETDFFAAMLAPPFRPSPDWADHLSKSLLQPDFPIAHWEAIGWRFYRTYVWLITLLLVSWGVKLAIHPVPALDGAAIVERAAVGPIVGEWVVAAVGAMYGAMAALAVVASIPDAWREALPKPLHRLAKLLRQAAGPLAAEPHPQEQMAIIITTNGQSVASRLMEELGRGVTALKGTGMYTDETRDVLLCAVTDVQVSHLREIVCQTDPHAFVVVSRAAEVIGRGFGSFDIPS